MNNLLKTWNDRAIRIRSDRYVSLTDMATATGREFKHWNENKGTKSYLEVLSSKVGIPTSDLVQVKKGGTWEDQGTWGHPKVAIRFAQWCNDEFAVQVDCWMDELMTTGKVELTSSQQPQLLPEQRLQIGMNALQFFSIDQTNPRYAQGLQDWCLNLMLGQKRLPESTERWLGVAERAEELGYGRIGADLSLRTRLGTFVSKCDLERKREERLCNGTQRKIWIYRVCDEFDAVIVNFFEAQP